MEPQIAYFEDYLDTVESLPFEITRNFTRIRELDGETQRLVRTLRARTARFLAGCRSMPPEKRRATLVNIIGSLRLALQHSEEKVALATKTHDAVDTRVRRLDADLDMFESNHSSLHATFPFAEPPPPFGIIRTPATMVDDQRLPIEPLYPNNRPSSVEGSRSSIPQEMSPPRKNKKLAGTNSNWSRNGGQLQGSNSTRDAAANSSSGNTAGGAEDDGITPKRSRKDRQRGTNGKDTSNSKRRQQSDETQNTAASDTNVDPNEPLYCICNNVSYGEMVACDNEDCAIEWFHLACIGLTKPPSGTWLCPDCSSKRGRYRS